LLTNCYLAIADYTGNKLKFLKFFCLLGSVSVMCLFFLKDPNLHLWVALTFTILASIGFWGSIVFYNAYLPEVAYPEQQDEVSAKGFIYGYAGSVLLLFLVWFWYKNQIGLEFLILSLAPRITFLLVGVWWFGFAQITYNACQIIFIIENLKRTTYGKV